MTATPPVQRGPDGQPLRTVVLIPTINNADQLDVVLEALSRQTYPHFEVVCVDSKSHDHTRKVIEAWDARWIDDDSRNRADACNHGLRVIDCDVVLFTDDDTIPPDDWVERLIRWFDRPEVAGVGGPNVAPDEDPWLGRLADVAIHAKWVTAGTRYGRVTPGELSPIEHNPGCNAGYLKSALDEVGGFEDGCIGAEDVVLDLKLERANHQLWYDPTAIMPHRRRSNPRPYMRQLRNYGYVRTLANHRWPALKQPTHTLVGAFPLVVWMGLVSLALGVLAGGLDLSDPLGPDLGPRAMVHVPITLGLFYVGVSWVGAAAGKSPHRGLFTILLAPAYVFLAHWAYGSGVTRGLRQIKSGGAAAGLGLQVDDKVRTAPLERTASAASAAANSATEPKVRAQSIAKDADVEAAIDDVLDAELADDTSTRAFTASELRGMLKAELVAMAEAQGLATSGTKADLVERLTE